MISGVDCYYHDDDAMCMSNLDLLELPSAEKKTNQPPSHGMEMRRLENAACLRTTTITVVVLEEKSHYRNCFL